MEPSPERLVEALGLKLAEAGVDIVTPLVLGWYNESIPAELGARIPARAPAGQGALAVLVANSRAVWEPFVEACAARGLLQHDNPLEAYLEEAVCGALAAAAPGLRHRIYWSHRRTGDLEAGPEGAPPSEHVAFQRMAHAAGLAYLDNSSHLSLHPRFGPWFSLRCVLIFDDLEWRRPRPAELQNPLPEATQQYVRMALHTAVHNTSRKFRLPEVDVEAAEATLMEASMDPVIEEDEGGEEQGGGGGGSAGGSQRGHVHLPGCGGDGGGAALRCPSSALSQAGSDVPCGSGGSTPTCSSGASTPRGAPPPAGPDAEPVGSAAARLAAVSLAAEPVAVPAARGGSQTECPCACSPGADAAAAAQGGSPSGLQSVGSLGSCGSRRSSLESEGKPCIRAITANWRAWVAVRDSPCPGHPMRYSEEQIAYHYTRDRSLLAKAMLRRGCVPAGAALPAPGLLDPALASFHAATMEAQKSAGRRRSYATACDLAAEVAVAAPITAL